MGREPNNLEMILLRQKAGQQLKDSTKVIPFQQKRSFAEEIEAMKKSGDIVDAEDINISEKITDRDMFNNSFLKKPTIEGQMEKITGASNRIKEIKKEQADMYKPKTDAEIAAKYDKQNKEAAQRIRNKRMLDEDEIAQLDEDIGGLEYTNDFDGTLGSANKLRKERADYIRDMELEYKKGNLDPKPGEANRERFLQKKFDEMEASGDNRLMTREEIEELSSFGLQKDMDKSVKKFKEKDAKQKKTLKDFDPEDRDPSATGGRAGFYTGGITDVEPSLDDIGHGSDALNARTRLMSPGAQATTSTGLNYLLAEDNDNMRVPFSEGNTVNDKIKTMHKDFDNYRKGGGKISYKKFAEAYIPENFAEGGRIGLAGGGGRRAFLKLIASLGGTAAAFKTGILGLGEGGAKKAVTETVKQAAGSGGQVPPYFLNLVKKIKTMGDDVTPSYAVKDRQKVTKYKDYELTEDITTGEQTIQRMKVLDDDSASYYGQPLTEETYMSYKPGKGQADELTKGKTPPDEYEEGTALLRSDRGNAGDVVDESATISDDVIKEGTVFEDTLSEFGKADGGRIGFSGGGIFRAIIARSAAKKGMSVTDFIKATNYKGLSPEVRMYISADEFAKLKGGQQDLYQNFIDMAKTRKSFQESVEAGKKGPASPLFENLEKTMDEQSFVPKTVTSDDIAQMELMVKNRFNKGRKDNAQGGLQTMLGE